MTPTQAKKVKNLWKMQAQKLPPLSLTEYFAILDGEDLGKWVEGVGWVKEDKL